MSSITECIQRGDMPSLAALCEDKELTAAVASVGVNSIAPGHSTSAAPSTSGPDPTSRLCDPSIYVYLLLAHMILNDLPAARSLVRRVPPHAQVREFTALADAASHLWARDLPAFHAVLASSEAAIQWSSPHVAALVERLAVAVRDRTLALLARAYTSVSIADAAALLGWAVADVPARVAQLGWEINGEWVVPKAAPAQKLAKSPGLVQMAGIADVVIHLEKAA
ncbi:COP9 signalosome [Blyttiomyces helicus]|uniref:COP9 signalosome n=1 Tax=Blyttiomyces helicus TaxID=388810 RepID=A0A4V1IRF0_9FUNG|nr:COP9 signalosome [Blyttiomyces helicus]|eukprot:RKO89827.1 COP9 signalosome [Blyttiomyces helicus]